MIVNFVLLWWHIPIGLIIAGMVMMYFGNERYIGSFGWPDDRFTNTGCFGAAMFVIGLVLLIGSIYRGFFNGN